MGRSYDPCSSLVELNSPDPKAKVNGQKSPLMRITFPFAAHHFSICCASDFRLLRIRFSVDAHQICVETGVFSKADRKTASQA